MPRSVGSVELSAHRALERLAGTGVFVGREHDIESLSNTVATARWITVLGPAGMGKTRLAVEFARGHAHAFAGGVWFCDASDARSSDDVCALVARALGVPLDHASLADALDLALASRGHALVVLDNAESAADAVAAWVSRWLAAAPALHVIVTSRERLRARDETVFALEPLAIPDATCSASPSASPAVALLLDRAQRSHGASVSREHDLPVIAEIARTLEGIPLALELAASRLGTLEPTALLRHVSRQLDALGRGPRDAPTRAATMRGAIDSSWSMLSSVERNVLAQCAVFRGGFTADSALAVVNVRAHLVEDDVHDTMDARDTSPLDVLEALRDKSMLTSRRAGDRARLHLFHVIRAYVMERIHCTQAWEALCARHAAHMATQTEALAARADGPDGEDASMRLLDELDNVRAAEDRACESRNTVIAVNALRARVAMETAGWTHAGSCAQTERSLTALLTLPDAMNACTTTLISRALSARANARRALGRLDDADRDAHTAVMNAELAGDPTALANALRTRAAIEGQRGDRLRAVQTLALAYARLERADGNVVPLGATQLGLAHALRNAGRLCDARVHAEGALDRFRSAESTRWEGVARTSLAMFQLEAGLALQARANCERAMEIHTRTANARWRAITALLLACIAHDEGANLEEVSAAYERAEAQLACVGERRHRASSRGYRALVWLEQGRAQDAWALFCDAQQQLNLAGDPHQTALFLGYAAVASAAERCLERAHNEVNEAWTRVASSDARDILRSIAMQQVYVARAIAQDALAHGALEQARVARQHADTWLERANTQDEATEQDTRSFDVRVMQRIMRASFAPATDTARDALWVHRAGAWFQPPASDRVSIARRHALRRVLVALAERRLDAPGEPISWDQALHAGWPGERVSAEAGQNRVYVAIGTLRRLGLDRALRTIEGGYLLDPAIPLGWSTEHDPA